jgi:hypothetical protein
MESIVRLADNIVVHDPEVNLGKINSTRLRAHGWSEDVVQQQLGGQVIITETTVESAPKER